MTFSLLSLYASLLISALLFDLTQVMLLKSHSCSHICSASLSFLGNLSQSPASNTINELEMPIETGWSDFDPETLISICPLSTSVIILMTQLIVTRCHTELSSSSDNSLLSQCLLMSFIGANILSKPECHCGHPATPQSYQRVIHLPSWIHVKTRLLSDFLQNTISTEWTFLTQKSKFCVLSNFYLYEYYLFLSHYFAHQIGYSWREF